MVKRNVCRVKNACGEMGAKQLFLAPDLAGRMSGDGLKELPRFGNNVVQADVVFDAGRRVVDSRLDLASTPAEELTVYNQVLAILVELEGIYENRAKTLRGKFEVIRIRFVRLTTEVDILKAESEAMSVSEESN